MEGRYGITGTQKKAKIHVMGRAQKIHGGAGGTMTGIRKAHRELEMQHWESWAVMRAGHG